jgi:hypothetical protein
MFLRYVCMSVLSVRNCDLNTAGESLTHFLCYGPVIAKERNCDTCWHAFLDYLVYGRAVVYSILRTEINFLDNLCFAARFVTETEFFCVLSTDKPKEQRADDGKYKYIEVSFSFKRFLLTYYLADTWKLCLVVLTRDILKITGRVCWLKTLTCSY